MAHHKSFTNDFTIWCFKHILSTAKWPIPLGKVGGAGRDRTDDILLAKQALSQLSYGPGMVNAEATIPI
jgi:hypothetical protein